MDEPKGGDGYEYHGPPSYGFICNARGRFDYVIVGGALYAPAGTCGDGGNGTLHPMAWCCLCQQPHVVHEGGGGGLACPRAGGGG